MCDNASDYVTLAFCGICAD